MTEPVTGRAYYFPSIEKKYGRPISYWLELIDSSNLTRHKALVDWLKADHGIGHGMRPPWSATLSPGPAHRIGAAERSQHEKRGSRHTPQEPGCQE